MIELVEIVDVETVLNDLHAYLRANKIQITAFAARVGISTSDATRYMRGRATPSGPRYIHMLMQADHLIRENGDDRGINAIL